MRTDRVPGQNPPDQTHTPTADPYEIQAKNISFLYFEQVLLQKGLCHHLFAEGFRVGNDHGVTILSAQTAQNFRTGKKVCIVGIFNLIMSLVGSREKKYFFLE